MRRFTAWLFFTFHIALSAYGDYGILPPFQTLYVTGGFDFLTTGTNFDTNSISQPVTFSGQNATINQFTIWSEGEYGIAKDWALRGRFSFVTATSKDSSGNVLAAGSGMGDSILGLKWRAIGQHPGMTFELFTRLPFYSANAASASELVVGNGSIDVGFVPHLVTRSNNLFFFLSPGLVLRTNGYAAQFLLDAAVEIKFRSAFARAFYSGYWSLSETRRLDSSLAVHDSVGSAASYLRLSGSPSQMLLGAKLGIRFSENYFVQVILSQTIAGTRAPSYFSAGLNVGARFDFFDPPQPKKAHEVPLDGDPSEAL